MARLTLVCVILYIMMECQSLSLICFGLKLLWVTHRWKSGRTQRQWTSKRSFWT